MDAWRLKGFVHIVAPSWEWISSLPFRLYYGVRKSLQCVSAWTEWIRSGERSATRRWTGESTSLREERMVRWPGLPRDSIRRCRLVRSSRSGVAKIFPSASSDARPAYVSYFPSYFLSFISIISIWAIKFFWAPLNSGALCKLHTRHMCSLGPAQVSFRQPPSCLCAA
jgi:hypothetical protein